MISLKSHPSRDAWIEIQQKRPLISAQAGRIPRGMRGLKYSGSRRLLCQLRSHPSRDAWIEIETALTNMALPDVASLAGCVD